VEGEYLLKQIEETNEKRMKRKPELLLSKKTEYKEQVTKP
jgi:hypothetical protein